MLANLRARMRSFLKATGGNIAMTMALAAVPLVLATGAGIDYGRGLVAHSNMADALDAAALAVGKQTSKPTACSTAAGSTSAQQTACAGMKAVAQKFFDANYKGDTLTGGTQPTVVITIANSGVTLSATDSVSTTFLAAGGRLLGTTSLNTMAITASSTVVWGQTKLWVALVLDNSGSMSQNSKMTSLKTAAGNLLTTLQDASTTAGDVQVALVPFDRDINVGTGNVSASWLYWGFWESAGQANGTVITDTTNIANANFSSPSTIAFSAWGPGDDCPFTYDTTDWRGRTVINTMSPFGYKCTDSPPNNASAVDTIPSSGTYKGYICPGADGGAYNSDRHDHYYNGCWTSTKVNGSTVRVANGSSASCAGFSSSNCSCTGSGSSKQCNTQKWSHTWVINNHSTWSGCITDRAQDYDISNTAASSANTTGMPADNPSDTSCIANTISTLGYNWSDLQTQVTNMSPQGTTNQAIGVANGWLAMTPGTPYATPAIPSNTSRYIILLSDGLNTENRWWGDGSSTGTTDTDKIDDRMNQTCTAAKADGVIIYTLYLNTSSTSDSTPLSNCASPGKYLKVTDSASLADAFAAIGQQITNLRVSQ